MREGGVKLVSWGYFGAVRKKNLLKRRGKSETWNCKLEPTVAQLENLNEETIGRTKENTVMTKIETNAKKFICY